ncbi:hypothetical protein [Kineococcus rubinsiae]|uniref:hypothetical protein n=1 Tax=Kineococcus rubinsiae TaxID=2609562 RepID=UPI001430F58F|nr:hypothetical protein [Kineococcus rubinsiae]NIZ91122.1 hypothetical protein [Kineococcus rubinsiae]
MFTDRSPQRPLPAVPPGAPGRHYAAGSPNATRSGVRDVLRACLLPGRWTWLLLATSLGLAVLSVGFQALRLLGGVTGLQGVETLVDVDREAGIPAWFSTLLLAAAAAQLWAVASAARAGGSPWHRHWRVLSLVFGFLSADELTSMHERLTSPVRSALHLSGALRFSWIVVAVPVVLVGGLLFLRFLRALPAASRWAFVLAGLVYVAGAVGMELVGGIVVDAVGVPTTTTTTRVVEGRPAETTTTQWPTVDSVRYAGTAAVEETLEMVGSVLFLGAVTVCARRERAAVRLP